MSKELSSDFESETDGEGLETQIRTTQTKIEESQALIRSKTEELADKEKWLEKETHEQEAMERTNQDLSRDLAQSKSKHAELTAEVQQLYTEAEREKEQLERAEAEHRALIQQNVGRSNTAGSASNGGTTATSPTPGNPATIAMPTQLPTSDGTVAAEPAPASRRLCMKVDESGRERCGCVIL